MSKTVRSASPHSWTSGCRPDWVSQRTRSEMFQWAYDEMYPILLLEVKQYNPRKRNDQLHDAVVDAIDDLVEAADRATFQDGALIVTANGLVRFLLHRRIGRIRPETTTGLTVDESEISADTISVDEELQMQETAAKLSPLLHYFIFSKTYPPNRTDYENAEKRLLLNRSRADWESVKRCVLRHHRASAHSEQNAHVKNSQTSKGGFDSSMVCLADSLRVSAEEAGTSFGAFEKTHQRYLSAFAVCLDPALGNVTFTTKPDENSFKRAARVFASNVVIHYERLS